MLIILIVFFPILTLTGIESKYFTPMASLFLKRTVTVKPTLADRFFDGLNKVYGRILRFSLSHVWGTITASFVALLFSLLLFTKLGAEFIPTLDEGNKLCVSNRIQPKLTDSSSTCIGLANLSKRYRLLFGQDITIEENEKLFKATLPLI